MALPPRNERHLWLRVYVLNFDLSTEEMEQVMTERLRMEQVMTERLRMGHTDAQGKIFLTSYAWRALFGIRGLAYWVDNLREIAFKAELRDYWTRISFVGDFLSTVPSYTLIREPLRRLCHRLIAFSIDEKGQAPEKGGRMSGGYFIAQLGVYFRVITEKSLQALTMGFRELTTIDVDELVRLRICVRLGDVVTWVVLGPQRSIPHSLLRLEEEVHGLCESIREQLVLLDRMSSNQERFSSWVVGRMTRLIGHSGLSFPRTNGFMLAVSSSNVYKIDIPGIFDFYLQVTHELTNGDDEKIRPEYTKDEKTVEWLTQGHLSVHEMD
ncbi:hypothetical protein Tco_0764608, partial [Tanacetum coccineum]